MSSSVTLDSRARDLAGWIVWAWLGAVIAASWALMAALTIYAGTIVYGLAAGYALPTATIFDLLSFARVLYRVSLYFPWALLVAAAIGALCGWIGVLSPEVLQGPERRLIRFWGYAGFPAIVLIFLIAMSTGAWSGRFVPTEMNYMATGGLAPYSDAKSYYGSSFDIGYWGHWDWVASQRPLAAAIRNLVVLLGGESYQGSLVAQAVLIGAASMFALYSVVAWRGIWVGIAFFAFVYGLARPFLLTAMTEPIGLILGLFSVGYFVEALRRHSLACALVGFAALTAALTARMGSMFSIPFLALWISFVFGSRWASRLKIFLGTVAIAVAVLVTNGLLFAIYAPVGADIGGNLSYTLCGFAHGSSWGFCESLLAEQISKTPSLHARDMFLYGEALRAFLADPSIAFNEFLKNVSEYVARLPELLLEEYSQVAVAHYDRNQLARLVVLLLPGWAYLLGRPKQMRNDVLLFMLVLFASTALSAGVIFADDGTRAMEVTYAFMALAFAVGLAAPASVVRPVERPLLPSRGGAVAIAIALPTLLAVPALQGAAIRAVTGFHGPVATGSPNVNIVGGAPALTGFLVLPDGVQRPRDVPAFNATTFIAMYKSIYTPELGPSAVNYLPEPPFAMVFSVTQNGEDYRWDFITPAEVLTDKTAPRWQFQIAPEKSPPRGLPFLLVSRATPIE